MVNIVEFLLNLEKLRNPGKILTISKSNLHLWDFDHTRTTVQRSRIKPPTVGVLHAAPFSIQSMSSLQKWHCQWPMMARIMIVKICMQNTTLAAAWRLRPTTNDRTEHWRGQPFQKRAPLKEKSADSRKWGFYSRYSPVIVMWLLAKLSSLKWRMLSRAVR